MFTLKSLLGDYALNIIWLCYTFATFYNISIRTKIETPVLWQNENK